MASKGGFRCDTYHFCRCSLIQHVSHAPIRDSPPLPSEPHSWALIHPPLDTPSRFEDSEKDDRVNMCDADVWIAC